LRFKLEKGEKEFEGCYESAKELANKLTGQFKHVYGTLNITTDYKPEIFNKDSC
jgi:hypothetical protein